MKAKEYPLLLDAVESGVAYGLTRADKHASDPLTDAQRERVQHCVEEQVVNAILERFDLDHDHAEEPE